MKVLEMGLSLKHTNLERIILQTTKKVHLVYCIVLPLKPSHGGDTIMGCAACLAWEKDNVGLFF